MQSTTFTWRLSLLLLMSAAASLPASANAGEAVPLKASLVRVTRIWDRGRHNAFTDLIRWHDQWWCAFREGQSHANSRGRIRVIRSQDGVEWMAAATLEDPVYDLRDANFSVTPDGQLMLVGGIQIDEEGTRQTGSIAMFSDDGSEWTSPEVVSPLGRWLWGVTWHDGKAWGVTYGTPEDTGETELLVSHDGRHFDKFVPDMCPFPEYPTEARIRFDTGGQAYCLQRCDGKDNRALIGMAQPPYRHWWWRRLDRYIGGPNLLQLPSGQWIAAGRIIVDGKPRTALLWLDADAGSVNPVLNLPSAGDSSYPGLVWHKDQLWMSYYSSHEQHTSIYLAVIDIDELPAAEASSAAAVSLREIGTRRNPTALELAPDEEPAPFARPTIEREIVAIGGHR